MKGGSIWILTRMFEKVVDKDKILMCVIFFKLQRKEFELHDIVIQRKIKRLFHHPFLLDFFSQKIVPSRYYHKLLNDHSNSLKECFHTPASKEG